jgi:hypothetical protein
MPPRVVSNCPKFHPLQTKWSRTWSKLHNSQTGLEVVTWSTIPHPNTHKISHQLHTLRQQVELASTVQPHRHNKTPRCHCLAPGGKTQLVNNKLRVITRKAASHNKVVSVACQLNWITNRRVNQIGHPCMFLREGIASLESLLSLNLLRILSNNLREAVGLEEAQRLDLHIILTLLIQLVLNQICRS